MTPDNAGQTTSDLLEELGAASQNYPDGVRADHEDEDIAAIHRARLASDELEMITEDHLSPVVAALEGIKARLDQPSEMHCYIKGIHQSPCAACVLRQYVEVPLADLRKALTEAPAATKEGQDG